MMCLMVTHFKAVLHIRISGNILPIKQPSLHLWSAN